MTTIEKMNLILKILKNKELTANRIINSIYKSDFKNKVDRNSWRFYVHLNKLFAPMERKGLIEFTGKYECGETKRNEKIWRIKDEIDYTDYYYDIFKPRRKYDK